MTSTAPHSRFHTRNILDDSIKASLEVVEQMLDRVSEHLFNEDYFLEVGLELRRVQARVRVRHAAVNLASPEHGTEPIQTSLLHERKRLESEHSSILKQLSRLSRGIDGIADETLEDKQIFILRVRELIATLRRHEAEEDRLFYLSVWQSDATSG